MKIRKAIFPKNKELFKKLIPFSQKIIKICRENKVDPIIYGSFAHFYHTQDEELKVNDIDLYVSENSFKKIIHTLNNKKIKYKYVPEWHTLIIKEGKLRVEIDSFDFFYKNLSKSASKINFYGIKTKIIPLKNLEELYLIAYNRTNDNKRKILKKIKHLENFLGRRLR